MEERLELFFFDFLSRISPGKVSQTDFAWNPKPEASGLFRFLTLLSPKAQFYAFNYRSPNNAYVFAWNSPKGHWQFPPWLQFCDRFMTSSKDLSRLWKLTLDAYWCHSRYDPMLLSIAWDKGLDYYYCAYLIDEKYSGLRLRLRFFTFNPLVFGPSDEKWPPSWSTPPSTCEQLWPPPFFFLPLCVS